MGIVVNTIRDVGSQGSQQSQSLTSSLNKVMSNTSHNLDMSSISCPIVSECTNFSDGIAKGDFFKAVLNGGVLALSMINLSMGGINKVAMNQCSASMTLTQAAALSGMGQVLQNNNSQSNTQNTYGGSQQQYQSSEKWAQHGMNGLGGDLGGSGRSNIAAKEVVVLSDKYVFGCEEIFEMLKARCMNDDCNTWAAHFDAVLGFVITPERNPKSMPARFYEVDFRYIADHKCTMKKKNPTIQSDAKAVFMMADEDFVKIVKGELNPRTAYDQGIMKVKGDFELVSKFVPEMFPYPSDKNRAKLLKHVKPLISKQIKAKI